MPGSGRSTWCASASRHWARVIRSSCFSTDSKNTTTCTAAILLGSTRTRVSTPSPTPRPCTRALRPLRVEQRLRRQVGGLAVVVDEGADRLRVSRRDTVRDHLERLADEVVVG